MLKIALTGPMGSGKSTLADKLRLYGAYIADIDDIIKTHLQTNDTVINVLHSEFGPTFIQEGQINLRLMYELFSKDHFSYSRFHKIIHPFIETTATELYKQAKKSNFKYFVLAAPYVIEDKNSLNRKFDFIVSVECSKENQINRLIKRTNLSKKNICDLIRQDFLSSERKLQANLILQNDSNFKHVEILAAHINNSIQKIGNTKKFFNLKRTILSMLLFSGFSGALSAAPCINTAVAAGTPITSSGSYTGNIGVCGSSATGIYLSNGNNSIVNMTGNITAINEDISIGNGTAGIYLENATLNNRNSIVNLTGNVTTSGLSSYGIYLINLVTTGSSNKVNMTGNISIAGGTSLYVNAGILMNNTFSSSSSNTTNMTGNITGSDNYLFGIGLNNTGSSDSSNTANMSGNIMLSGNNSRGIDLQRHNLAGIGANTVNMIGNVTTSGNDSRGISLYTSITAGSTGSSIVNFTGRISASGLNSYAIYAFNDTATSTNTVQLNKGSSVIGAINGSFGSFPANNFLKLNLGAGASYSFATTGFTVQDLNGRPMVTGSAYAAGVGNVTTASQSLYERTSQVTQSLDDRVRTYDAKQNTSQDFWMNTYYSDSNRGGQGLSGSNLSFNQYRSGITAGFNIKNSYTPTELIVNYEHGKLNIDEGNQGISSNSVMAGALFPDIKKLFTGTLSAKALIGYSDFSGDRKVLTNDVALNGSRNVTASYQSTHLTLGSAWTKTLYQTDKVTLDTLVGIDLNTQHINSYSESDLFKWNSRTINQLQERVTLGMEMKPFVKPLTLFGRVGIERRDLLSGENQNYAINNTAVSYNDSNQRNTYATLNAGAYYPLTPLVKAYAQVRYYDSTKDIDSLSGSIGISGQF